jgi:hypothetical protein
MEFLHDTYFQAKGFWDVLIFFLIFCGIARIAFWHNSHGLIISGPLVIGLALLLTISIIIWGHEHKRSISEYGPVAAFLVLQAIIVMCFRFRKKSKE